MIKAVKASLLAAFLLSAFKVQGETLVIAGDLWCPVNCALEAEQQGVFVELAQEIFAEHGISVKYRSVNWARALFDARQGKVGAVIGAGVEDAPDFIFSATAPALSRMCFYALEGSSWRYKGLESLKSVRLGAINGYSYGRQIDDYLEAYQGSEQVQLVTGGRALVNNVLKLEHGRIDVLVENAWVMEYAIKRDDLGVNIKEVGCREGDVPIYLAFSPVLRESQRYVEIFEDGLQRFKANGRLAQIFARYGVH